MAKYSIGVQNVRKDFSSAAVGTKDDPVANALYTVITAGSAPNAAACEAALLELLPQLNPTASAAAGTAIAAGTADATARASDVTGAHSFRHGKGVYQYGVGYHASDDQAAIDAINWKNLS